MTAHRYQCFWLCLKFSRIKRQQTTCLYWLELGAYFYCHVLRNEEWKCYILGLRGFSPWTLTSWSRTRENTQTHVELESHQGFVCIRGLCEKCQGSGCNGQCVFDRDCPNSVKCINQKQCGNGKGGCRYVPMPGNKVGIEPLTSGLWGVSPSIAPSIIYLVQVTIKMFLFYPPSIIISSHLKKGIQPMTIVIIEGYRI